MSNNFYYSGYERDCADARGADFHAFEKCSCRETGMGRICTAQDCPSLVWSKQEREPIDKTRSRQVAGGWEYAMPHLHRCDCSSARRWWRIYDQQKDHRLGRSTEM